MVAREAPAALGSLRQLLVGGEQMDLVATERVLAAGGPELLLNIYGPTETTVVVTTFTCTPRTLAGRTRIPIGQPCAGCGCMCSTKRCALSPRARRVNSVSVAPR